MGFNKRESSCTKYMLIIFNFLLLLVGGAVLGVGVYTLTTDFGAKEMSVLLGGELYLAGAYTLIVGGAVVIFISLVGCCGAFIESKCLLWFYGILTLLTLICFVAACVVGFIFRSQLKEQVKKETETNLIYKYGVDQKVTDAWDDIQTKMKCCGVSGDVNSTRSWAVYKLNSTWFSDSNLTDKLYVPESCCKPDNNTDTCTGKVFKNGIPVLGPPLNSSVPGNDYLYTDGCYDKIIDHMDKYALIIGSIAVATAVVMLLGLILSCCLCRHINRGGYMV